MFFQKFLILLLLFFEYLIFFLEFDRFLIVFFLTDVRDAICRMHFQKQFYENVNRKTAIFFILFNCPVNLGNQNIIYHNFSENKKIEEIL